MRALLPLLIVVGCGPIGGDADEPVPLTERDDDHDGFPAAADCDDDDPFAYPGAVERCNGRDDDCDGQVDGAGSVGTTAWYVDVDGDGYGAGTPVRACDPTGEAEGRVAVGTDCDDTRADVFPGQVDTCDGRDSDCNGHIDDAPDQGGYPDADGDGFGATGADFVRGCFGVDIASVDGDCDDTNPAAHPDGVESCAPGDEDCDGFEGDADPEGAFDALPFLADADGDGFGDDGRAVMLCEPTDQVVLEGGDCDDDDPATYPGAVELCSGKDQNCDDVLPAADAWFDLDHELRIPVTLTGLAGRGGLPVTIEVDLVDELNALPFVPYDVVAVVPTCAEGPTIVPAQYTDGLADPFAPDPVRVLGDSLGSVHLVLPELDAGVDELVLDLYFGGPRALVDDPSRTTEASIQWEGRKATFDDQRLGRLDDLTLDGERVSSQADLVSQGVQVGGDWLSGTAELTPRSYGPVLTAMHVTTTIEPDKLQGSELWFAYAGVSELFVNVDLVTTQETAVQAAVPYAFAGPIGAVQLGADWVAVEGADYALGARWGVSPLTSAVSCDALGCWAEGSELGLPQVVPAGSYLLSGAVLALSAQEAPFVGEGLERLWPRPAVDVGETEWQP